MKNFEESEVYWQGLRKKYLMDPSFQVLVKVGLTPLSRRPGFWFPERHTSPSICLTVGSVLSGLLIDVQEQYAGMWCKSNFHKKVCELNPKV